MSKATVRDITFEVSDGIINIKQGDQYIVIVEADLDDIKKLIAEDDAEIEALNDELNTNGYEDEQPDFGGQVGAENDARLAQFD